MILLSGPNISGNEWKYVKECLDTAWVSSVGAYVTRFEEMLAEFVGAKYAVACVNGTNALHLSLQIAGVRAKDQVLVPNITFIASVNAIKYCGADPIFVDVDKDTWQMDLDLLESWLEENTYMVESYENEETRINPYSKFTDRPIAAIMPVHVLGNMCDMDRLVKIAQKYHLQIIEDATESLGSYYNGKHSGTFGKFGCFSFNGNKIITTGGGGMIVTDNKTLAKKAKHLTTQAKTHPFEYIHDEIGYNYRLVNILAAMGVAQMEQLPGFIERKHQINRFYRNELEGTGDIQFQKIIPQVNPNYWLFTFNTSKQKELLTLLNEREMQSRPFWVPMNRLKMFKKDIYINDKDISGKVYGSCLSIPCSTNITDSEMQLVVDTIKSVY